MKKDIDICVVDIVPKDNKTDIAILKKLHKGDFSAFEQLYYRWSKQVYGFMLKTTRSVSDAEDITQEVFVRLWNMRESIDPEKNIKSLIFTIARRIAVDLYRHNGKLAETSYDEPGGGLSQDKSPLEILVQQETSLLLDIAIESMPEKQREVFSLYYYKDTIKT